MGTIIGFLTSRYAFNMATTWFWLLVNTLQKKFTPLFKLNPTSSRVKTDFRDMCKTRLLNTARSRVAQLCSINLCWNTITNGLHRNLYSWSIIKFMNSFAYFHSFINFVLFINHMIVFKYKKNCHKHLWSWFLISLNFFTTTCRLCIMPVRRH